MEDITAGTEEVIAEGRHAIDSWAASVERKLQEAVESHKQNMASAMGDHQALQEQKRRMREIAERLREEMQNEAQKEQELRSAIEEAERATQDYKPKLEALGAQEKEKARELAQCKEDIARVKKRNARTLNEMTRGTLFFRRLGLDFVYIDEETLQFIFTQVDPVDPERQFSIDISVAQNNYCVKQCEPALEGLDDYVHDINRTNDLALFLKRVRRGFRSYAQQQQQ